MMDDSNAKRYNFVIKKYEDYSKYYSQYHCEFLEGKNSKGFSLFFEIYFEVISGTIDLSLVLEAYLIALRLRNQFSIVNIHCNFPYSSIKKGNVIQDDNYYRLQSTVALIKEYFDNSSVRTFIVYTDGTIEYINANKVNAKRMLPIIKINKESYNILKSPVTTKTFESMISLSSTMLKPNAELSDILHNMCYRLLTTIDNEKGLSDLREKIFIGSEKVKGNFKEHFIGRPLLSLVIFALFDYSYRHDAVDTWKKNIKSLTGQEKVTLYERDFSYAFQHISGKTKSIDYSREYYDANRVTEEEGYFNKDLIDYHRVGDKTNEVISSFLVNEVLEATIISEGLLQLIENVVKHAGQSNHQDDGEGLLSIHLHENGDIPLLNQKYNIHQIGVDQFNKCKYFLEVIVADLSSTTVADKFREKNIEYVNEKMGHQKNIFEALKLKDFFAPAESQSFWELFFDDANKAVNHYGLQIFDSILTAKSGVFSATSGSDEYCNTQNSSSPLRIQGKRTGSSYSLLLPMATRVISNESSYDAMLTYDLKYLIQNRTSSNFVNVVFDKEMLNGDKESQVKSIKMQLERLSSNSHYLIRASNIDTEVLMKGILVFIFSRHKNCTSKSKLRFALVGYSDSKILELIRIISLYYNKHGENAKMENVEIYIRGKTAGEEIVIHGKSLSSVKHSIKQMTAMRGYSPKHIEAITRIFDR